MRLIDVMEFREKVHSPERLHDQPGALVVLDVSADLTDDFRGAVAVCGRAMFTAPMFVSSGFTHNTIKRCGQNNMQSKAANGAVQSVGEH